MNKKTIIIAVVALVVVVLIFIPTKVSITHGNNYEVKVLSESSLKDVRLSQVFLHFDNSGSMKGYTDFAGYRDAKKTIISHVTNPLDIVRDQMRARLSITCGQFNTDDVDTFRNRLSTGEILTGAITPLDRMIKNSVDEVSDTTVSILVSDMVLSYGLRELNAKNDYWLNKHNLSDLGSAIHTALSDAKKQEIHVLIVQYYSDFNGKYYYNCTENLVNGSRYKDSLMSKRPFYLMVLGKEPVLKNLLSKQVFRSYENLYTSFGVDSNELKAIKYSISADASLPWVYDNSAEDPEGELTGTIWTKDNLEKQKDSFYVKFDKFSIPPYAGKSYQIADYSHDPIIDHIEGVTDTRSDQLTFKITMKAFDQLPDSGTAQFELVGTASWRDSVSFSTSTVEKDDDVSVASLQELEKKTWGFSTILRNIDKVYFPNGRQPDVLARLKFNISKK